ncbi:hypothetical protein CPC08DRAFT_223226 [Agrocybe pediades]|nr:hypothetical protein CPC08DRAFT_223226 [Agrocybe pediades]
MSSVSLLSCTDISFLELMFGNNPFAHAPPLPPWTTENMQYTQLADDLPPIENRPPSVTRFTFTRFEPDITSCVVLGPAGNKYFDINSHGYCTTILKSTPSEVCAKIFWNQNPVVETSFHGQNVFRQLARAYLALSRDGSHRMMQVKGRSYIWIPRENGTYLYGRGSFGITEEYARTRLAEDMCNIHLEIANPAFPRGLFEPCILSTALLYSGRSIE